MRGLIVQPGSYALIGSSQLRRDGALAQNHGEDLPRGAEELETGCYVQAADEMQGGRWHVSRLMLGFCWLPLTASRSHLQCGWGL